MARTESLDELIARKAVEFADEMKLVAAMADKEEEIRIEVEKRLAFIQKEAGIKLEGKQEFTVASGRVDSVYDRVIIEYKNPSNPGVRIGPMADSPGSKKVVEQIKKRFYDMRIEHGQPLNTLFGVGFDGRYFIFVRYRDDKWQVQEPVELSKYSAERFLWAIFNLGHKGRPFSPAYLAGEFGSEAKLAQDGIHSLYEAIAATDHPKAQTFFRQWKILFAEVCGYDVDDPSDKIRKLAQFYGVPSQGLKPAELLFAVHTYYALFMKLLASEIVAFFHRLPTPLERMMSAGTSNKLKREMEDIEAGGIFRHLNITNFLEGDLFAWYTSVWTEPVERLIRDMVTRLDNYNPGTLSEDPVSSRDLLKKLYHELFPKSVRHDLGEYYTPDWLAEHVLSEVGYVGDPDKRLLDPACGSGTFLVMAINRIRSWFEENREKCRFDEGDLCRKILSNVIGFDLNPLAVMAARTNYLIAIRDLIGHVAKVELPVYLCDSLMTPSQYGGLFAGGSLIKAKELKTAAANFIIPTEIVTSPEAIGKYAEQLEFCIQNRFSAKEFLQRCRDEGLPVACETLHMDLYRELVRLDKANKNGVWARIIKNAFAPLFTGRVDYVAGNPPWVLWDNLPADFRENLRELMTVRYGIMASKQSTFTRLGQAKKDLCMAFFYVSLDRYCKETGRLGFVITQTLFQTTAADEFRRFRLPDNRPIKVAKVEDWVEVEPFRPKAGNKTAVVIADIGEETEYPVRYIVWRPDEDFDRESSDLQAAISACSRSPQWACPSDPENPRSFWAISSSRDSHKSIAGALMQLPKARAGVNTSLESAYKVEVLGTPRPHHALVRNITKGAKKPVPVFEELVEDQLLLPFFSGESLKRWMCKPAGYYIVPHTAETAIHPIDPATMKKHFRLIYSCFFKIKEQLESRSLHLRWGKNNPFYSLYNIGPYTFAPFRLCWQRTTKKFGCAVVGMLNTEHFGPRLGIPNGDIMFLPFDDEEDALYLSALLNSTPARHKINNCITTKAHKDIVSVVSIPARSALGKTSETLVSLARKCHHVAAKSKSAELHSLEQEIDSICATLWGVPKSEVANIRKRLDES
jgi:hypothetical protein